MTAARAGQRERLALSERLVEAAAEIKSCRSITVTCHACEAQIDDVMAAADAYAQAAIAAQDARPAPGLAAAMADRDQARADRNSARNVVCNLLDLFGAPDDRLMQHAGVPRAVLLRYASEAGVRLDGRPD